MTEQSVVRRVVMTGASGMVGTALTRALGVQGYTVVALSRAPVPGAVVWESATSELDPAVVSGAEVVINLAGENLADGRWTKERKEKLRSSRILTTEKLCGAIARAPVPPKLLISVSAVGFYGDRGDESLTEESTPGDDFLAQLCIEWEAACNVARDANVRVVHPRFGVIFSPHGGALDRMLPFFRAGVGGRYGDGTQWMAWITLDDVVRGIEFLIAQDAISSAVNFVAPGMVRNEELADTLGAVLHRPAVIPAPEFALHLALGEMADGALLGSQRVVPEVLQQNGFAWQYPELEAALRHVVEG